MENELHILWTNDNPITAKNMVLMYGHNALKNQWWDKVTIIIWGATAKLVAKDETIQKGIKEAMEDGVVFSACKACATNLGVTSELEQLGIEVKFWGEPLTEIIKNNKKLITI